MKLVFALTLLALSTQQADALDLGRCYARDYSAAHLAKHPAQLVTHIHFGLADFQSGGGIVNYDLAVRLRGSSEVFLGSAYCESQGTVYRCGMEGDAGNVIVSAAKNGSILISVGKGGVSFEGSDFVTLSATTGDDREFLLAPAPASTCR